MKLNAYPLDGRIAPPFPPIPVKVGLWGGITPSGITPASRAIIENELTASMSHR